MFYGLFIDGDLKRVIRWDRGEPTLFDFNVHICSWVKYDIKPVHVTWDSKR